MQTSISSVLLSQFCSLTNDDNAPNGYTDALKKAQEAVGYMQWLALKARPYIAAITATCAQYATKRPNTGNGMDNCNMYIFECNDGHTHVHSATPEQ